MNIELKSRILKGITAAIEDSAEDSLWDGWVHEELYDQMTEAAALVFDSSMLGQKFAEAQK